MRTNEEFFQEDNIMQVSLPNATVILVLGIISIVGCCCYGVIGLICGIIALIMANGATKLYNANPALYTESSYKNMNVGKICAIVGLILSVLSLIYMICVIAFIGIETLSNPELLQQKMMELMNQ